MEEFTTKQLRVLNLLSKPVDTDVKIEQLHAAAYPDNDRDLTPRGMQQRLGSIIARMNVKLKRSKSGRIGPGELRQTYRLRTNKKKK